MALNGLSHPSSPVFSVHMLCIFSQISKFYGVILLDIMCPNGFYYLLCPIFDFKLQVKFCDSNILCELFITLESFFNFLWLFNLLALNWHVFNREQRRLGYLLFLFYWSWSFLLEAWWTLFNFYFMLHSWLFNLMVSFVSNFVCFFFLLLKSLSLSLFYKFLI